MQDAVAYAAAERLPVAVQATGHGISVPLDGGLLISTRGLTGVTVDAAVVQLSGPNARVPLVADLRQLGGALRTGGGAVPYREAAYVLRMIAAGEGELPLEEIRPALEEIFAVVADETLGRARLQYGISTPTEHTAELWPAGTRRRLAGIKAEWDPANLFRAGPAVAA